MENICVKATSLEKFLVEEELRMSFDRRAIGDEEGTVIYRARLESELGDLPIYFIVDKTIFAIIRIVVGPNVVTEKNYDKIARLCAQYNSRYKMFKLYIEDVDNTVYLDSVYMSSDSSFEPELMYAVTNHLVTEFPNYVKDFQEAFGVEKVINAFDPPKIDDRLVTGHEN